MRHRDRSPLTLLCTLCAWECVRQVERLQQEKEEAEVARTTKGEFREHARRRSAEQELLRQQMKLQVPPALPRAPHGHRGTP